VGTNKTVPFTEVDGAHVGVALGGRRWRITPVLTGWQLEFKDRGDTAPTYAGTYGTVAAATAEAQH
jgi:hypothetical protein